MQVKVIGYSDPKKNSKLTPIKNADETNDVSGVDNVTAVREHLGLPSIHNKNDMAATFRSDLPMRNIESGKPISPAWSNSSGASKAKTPATGGTLSPNV